LKALSARQPHGGDSVDWAQNRRNMMLLGIIALIVVYIAFSVFGIIRDKQETLFLISSGLPQIQEVIPQGSLLDRIKNYFAPPARVIVPVEKKVTIKGRVIYSDGTPFGNGLVELHSQSRITLTDREGYFIFEDVEDGRHTISVLDQNHQMLASCIADINRNIQIEEAVLVPTADGVFVLELAVDIAVLEIVLEIRQDASGQTSLVISQDVRVPDAPPVPGSIPEVFPPEVPDPPVAPPAVSGEGGGGSGGGGAAPTAGKLTVYSSAGRLTYFTQTPAPINIFGADKRIAPGMTGAYIFTVDNTANDFAINYDIQLLETDNVLNIPMQYRLQDNKTGAYVNGDSNWHSPAQISAVTANSIQPLTMTGKTKHEYTLEWRWQDGGDDDNRYGIQHGGEVACTLLIQVSAQRK